MARTGMWHQAARGRAMVRSKSMVLARYWQAALGMSDDYMSEALVRYAKLRAGKKGTPALTRSDLHHFNHDGLVSLVCSEMRFAVERARAANRDWRQYRKYSRECGEMEAL